MKSENNAGKTVTRFLAYHLPLIIYSLVIILVSSIPHIKTPQLRFLAFDKVAHFVEYAILAFLTFRSFSHINKRITPNMTLLISALFLCFFALFDEFYQRFIPGRFFDVNDLLADFISAFLVLILMWFRMKKN